MAAIIEKENFTKNNYTNEYVIVVFNSSSCDPVHTNSHLYMQTVDIDEYFFNMITPSLLQLRNPIVFFTNDN
jgi:hypothetical protein